VKKMRRRPDYFIKKYVEGKTNCAAGQSFGLHPDVILSDFDFICFYYWKQQFRTLA